MYDIFDIFENSGFFQTPVGYREEIHCPVCRMTYSDFRKTGKLGCSECYKTFQSPISDVLRQIHQNPVHKGKIPSNMYAKLSQKRKLEELKQKLQAAVKDEKYEEAAKLHKEILELEKGDGK